MVELDLPFLHCDNIACISPRDTASADKSDYLVPHKLHVVKESHLQAPSVPQIGLNLLDSGWLRMLQIVNNFLLDILHHPLHLLMRTCRFLLVVLLPGRLTQSLSGRPQIVIIVRYPHPPLRHIQVATAIAIIVLLVNLLDLVELAHQLRENDSALEPRIQEEASEKERVVEATYISQDSHDGVDVPRVHVYLLVELEHLKEVETLAWACVWISNQIGLRAELIEVVLIISVEEAKEIVVQLERVLLVENDRLQTPTRQQRIVDVFHEVLDRLLKIVNVELSADHDLNHCDLLDPLVKL